MDERAAQIEISDWLEQQASASVYWSEDPVEGFGRFTMESESTRPDLLSTGNLNIVIELKDGDDSAGIYDAIGQLHGYWRSYEYGDSCVETDQGPVEVDAFVIATQYSPEGHLFKEDREQGFRQTYEKHEAGWNQGMRPQFEYARTEAIPP
jgi:hypothetical protein